MSHNRFEVIDNFMQMRNISLNWYGKKLHGYIVTAIFWTLSSNFFHVFITIQLNWMQCAGDSLGIRDWIIHWLLCWILWLTFNRPRPFLFRRVASFKIFSFDVTSFSYYWIEYWQIRIYSNIRIIPKTRRYLPLPNAKSTPTTHVKQQIKI